MNDILLVEKNRIAQEAFGATDIQGLFRGFFPAIQNFFHGYSEKFAPDTQGVVLTRDEKAFYAEITKHSYLDTSPLLAFVPEGLNENYLQYSKALENSTEHVKALLSGILSQYSLFLSNLLTNQDAQLDTNSFTHIYEKSAEDREKMNAEIAACFKAGSNVTNKTLGDIISRNTDWPRVFDNCHKLTKAVNEVDRKALKKKIAECSELLERIMEKMKRNEFDQMSPESAMNLANGAHAMASELEFFSATYFRVLTFVTAVNQTIEHTKKVLTEN